MWAMLASVLLARTSHVTPSCVRVFPSAPRQIWFKNVDTGKGKTGTLKHSTVCMGRVSSSKTYFLPSICTFWASHSDMTSAREQPLPLDLGFQLKANLAKSASSTLSLASVWFWFFCLLVCYLFLELGSLFVAQAGVLWGTITLHCSLSLGFEQSSNLSLLNSWDYRCLPSHPSPLKKIL